jgi:acetyl-CoA synthetase
MAEGKVVLRDGKYYPPDEMSRSAHVKSLEQYRQMYERSLKDPDGFWSEVAGQLHWERKWDRVASHNFDLNKGSVFIKWFEGGRTNVAYNCLDRHLEQRGDQEALLWEGNEPTQDRTLTYRQLHDEVCRLANVLKKFGVKKGDRVSVYMPMIPELPVVMLACARIGAVHSVVFGGFSADSLRDRILDSKCRLVVTTDGSYRGSKAIGLKENADNAMEQCEKAGHRVTACIVCRHTGDAKGVSVEMKEGRDFWWHEEVNNASPDCDLEWMDAEDPLFILYTSGSTGKPKGVLHTTGGYMVYTSFTHRLIFDYQQGDVYWCTADIGWVTGHSYIVYGPLLNGARTLMFEGVPNYPDGSRFWQVVDKWKVQQFYTAPTAIRAVAALGDDFVKNSSRKSIKLLGTVGEPINPEAWRWYHTVVGEERCPIVDTWWQTETGGILLTPLPGATPTKPGSTTLPFFGVEPCILSEKGEELEGECSGVLAMKRSWPGMLRSVYGDHSRFEETYFRMYNGYYFTGDGARRDADGYYWITGRVDDVINVSGHRLGTAEVESALVLHPSVAEAAVVGYPHDIKGTGIYAYVTLNTGVQHSDELKAELVAHVRKEIGPIATPDIIHWAPALPKTRSGKIMRRILRKIAEGASDQIGDTTTLADPTVVSNLIETWKKETAKK